MKYILKEEIFYENPHDVFLKKGFERIYNINGKTGYQKIVKLSEKLIETHTFECLRDSTWNFKINKQILMEGKDKESLLYFIGEEISHKKFGPMLDSFVSFAADKLGFKSYPQIQFKDISDNYQPSFASYNPQTNICTISTKNRHPMDIFRSLAHELVHHTQNLNGRLGHDIEKEGATGSDIENEANSKAGEIMRWYAKENPNYFKLSYVKENINKNFEDVFQSKPNQREFGTRSLTNIYKKSTPGQHPKKKIKFKRKTLSQESDQVGGYQFGNNGIGDTFGVVRSPTGLGYGYSIPMTENVINWINNKTIQKRFYDRWGDKAEEKLIEAASKINGKSITKIKESWSSGKDPEDKMGLYSGRDIEEDNELNNIINRKEKGKKDEKHISREK